MKQLHPGDAIDAQIIAVTGDCIFLDLNAKSEGILDRAELNDADGNCTVKEGDRITAYFTGEKNGEMRFTTRLSGDNAGGDLLEVRSRHVTVRMHVIYLLFQILVSKMDLLFLPFPLLASQTFQFRL